MFSDKLAVVKTVARYITVAGTSKVVHDIIQNNTTADTTTDQVKVVVGSLVLGSMIAAQVSEFTDGKVDSFVAFISSAKEEIAAAS